MDPNVFENVSSLKVCSAEGVLAFADGSKLVLIRQLTEDIPGADV